MLYTVVGLELVAFLCRSMPV